MGDFFRAREQTMVRTQADIRLINGQPICEFRRQTNSVEYSQNVLVYAMLDMLALRDGYTAEHVQRVKYYISFILEELRKDRKWGITDKNVNIITQSALLHDIGKIAIPDSILLKPGKLTQEEFDILKTHTTLGADSLKKSMAISMHNDFLQIAYYITKYHHEKWDGSGYPEGLKRDEIPLAARITAIADVYDALRSARPYKPAMDRSEARDIIINGKGSCFDPELIEVFLLVEHKYNDYCRQ